MSFRKGLLGLALCALSPAVALAQDSRVIEGGYEITFAGLAGFRIDFTARIDGTSYDVESHTFKESVLRALTMQYDGRNRAWGTFGPKGAQPSGGSLSLLIDRKPRTWRAQYGPGGTLTETHDPEWKPQPKDAIPDDKRTGSLDPLSAAIGAGTKGEAACDQVAPSNDGQRRIDVILHKVEVVPAAQSGIAGVHGDVLVCTVYTKRIAGLFYDQPEEDESDHERPFKLWLARLDDMPFYYPAKLEASTGFGAIRGRLLFFRERPLTEEEKVAIRH